MNDPRELEIWLQLIRALIASPGGLGRYVRTHWPGKSLADLTPSELSRLLALMRMDLPADPEPATPNRRLNRELSRDLAWLEGGSDRHLLPLTDPRYPDLLRQIPDPPPAVFVKGDPATLQMPCLSIVGTRNPTPQGRETARSFAGALAESGFVIASGLARGIDGCAHLGALEHGATVAVCAHGLDRVYPHAHRSLAGRIADNGALVSEFPPGTPPHRYHFPRRNRLISGLSLGTLVVEAGLRSGSLITARLAAEQNREVFAVPGSIHAPQSRGCHELIKKGVTLVESLEDMRREISAFGDGACRADTDSDAEETATPYTWFLEHMGYSPCTRDELVKRSGLTSAEVSSMLLTLELEGCVELCPGGTYVRVNRT